MTATDDPRTAVPTRTAATPPVSDPVPPPGPAPVTIGAPPPGAAPTPDWTALLPSSGGLGPVAVVGPATASSRALVAAAGPTGAGGAPAIVVVTRDRRRDVTRALALLGSGATLRVERSTPVRRTRLVRRLRRAGLDVSVWWHRPSTDRARCLVRLDHGPAAATVIRAVADRGRWVRLEAALAGSGLALLGAREVSLLARAPGVEPDAEPALAQPGRAHPVDGLVTPRFSTSRAVIGVSTAEGGRRLDRVVKAARRPEDDPLVEDEAVALDALLRRTGPFPGAPSRPAVERRGSRRVLVEDAVVGLPLDRRAVRRDPQAALAAGRAWVEGLPWEAPSRPSEDGRGTELVAASLAAIASRPGGWATRARRAEALLAPLVHEDLPVVFEHGDLCHPNVLRAPTGGLAVVDWERARTDGLPLHDLLLFAAYVVESVERPRGPAERARTVAPALRTHGWAWPEIALHAEHLEVDRRLVPLLSLASWTRRVAALGPRPAGSAPHRHEVLWLALLEDLEERRR